MDIWATPTAEPRPGDRWPWFGARETGFARDTVRKAMALLIDEGRVYVVRGLGTFVSPAK